MSDNSPKINDKSQRLIDLGREIVLNDYKNASYLNEINYAKEQKGTSEYIYDNQKLDALKICLNFYEDPKLRVASLKKKTKLGANGLMIQIATNMATHSDNNFVLDYKNIYFLTGMSNKSWETELKESMPNCFKENVFHHGQLQHLIKTLKDNTKGSLLFIDECDTGSESEQKLGHILRECGILDITFMTENNIRIILVSATLYKILKDLTNQSWVDNHFMYNMTIPTSYIGHKDFLKMGIIKEHYKIDSPELAEKWIKEDIIDYYGSEYRVHIIRVDEKLKILIETACNALKIEFKNHTSIDRITEPQFEETFNNIKGHVVIAVKGLLRRANLIHDKWKVKIGATHEQWVNNVDNDVQIQGLPGRMCGYWRKPIESGHKTGPHRTSINAIQQYEEFYENPNKNIVYKTNKSKKSLLHASNITNLTDNTVIVNSNKHIPIIIDNIDKDAFIFTKSRIKDKKIAFIKSLLKDKNQNRLLNFINNEHVECVQITMPDSDNSYKKQIVDIVKAAKDNKIFSISLKNKEIDNWQVFIDNREKRLCFVLWTVNVVF